MKVFNHGYVELIATGLREEEISEIAGISHDSPKGPSIEKLLEWDHMSPLEFGDVTYKIKCPIFVARQLFRHRTGKYMERSLRYCEGKPQFYIPPKGNSDLLFDGSYREIYKAYEELVASGEPKEQARAILPLGLYTEYYFKIDLRNLINLLKLRLHKDAQFETRRFAEAMLELIREVYPSVYNYVVKSI